MTRCNSACQTKLWRIFLLLALLTACLCCYGAALADGTYAALVHNPDPADRLNLREKPSEQASSLGRYYNGVTVQVEETLADGWVRVTIGTKGGTAQGYMAAQYLTQGQSVASAMPVYETVNRKWSLYSRPSTSATKVSLSAKKGMQVELMGFTENWWHVRVGEKTGFMRANSTALKLVSGQYYDGFRTAVVNNADPADRLNLRNRKSVNGTSLGKYYNGCVVAVLAEEKGGWVKVRIGNLTGYMESRYLLMDAGEGSVASALPTVTIDNRSGTGLRLRESPKQNAHSLGLYKDGTQVQVLGLSKNWYHVLVDGKIGFMAASGFGDQLSYTTTQTKAPSASGTAKPSSSGAWSGPVGKHDTGEWPTDTVERFAVVNNPDPADRLHLRAKASEDAASLGKYYNGTRALVTGSTEGEWVQVTIGNLHGYMLAKYLVVVDGGVPFPASAMPIMQVNNPNGSKDLHLRQNQSTASKSLGLYTNGTKVLLMGFNDEWAHVMVNGQTGFMRGKYLE